MSEENKKVELEDEKLEKVNGGSQTWKGSTYSSDYPFYLITTKYHKCAMQRNSDTGISCAISGTCSKCYGVMKLGAVYYCVVRKKGEDPLKN